LPFWDGAFSTVPDFGVRRVGDKAIEGLWRDRSAQRSYVPIKGYDSFNKLIVFDIFAEEGEGL
jgi:hypothetical protein